jgi:Uma2 family endonuclease
MGVQQAIIEDGEPVRHLLTVDEFLILDEAGAFDDVGRVELIEGEIYVLSPLFRPHGAALADITAAFHIALRGNAFGLRLYSPTSARLDNHSLPEADLIVATIEDDDFVSGSSARLMVEVAYSSLRHDLGRKAKLYARTGVPEYWVVDVKGRKIIRMADPVDETFARRDEFAFGDAIPSVTIEGLTIDTSPLA